MNRIYKSIWSWTRSCFVAVSEASNSHADGKNRTTLTKRSRAFKGRATFGAGYGFIGGTKGKQDHLFKLEAGSNFCSIFLGWS